MRRLAVAGFTYLFGGVDSSICMDFFQSYWKAAYMRVYSWAHGLLHKDEGDEVERIWTRKDSSTLTLPELMPQENYYSKLLTLLGKLEKIISERGLSVYLREGKKIGAVTSSAQRLYIGWTL